MHLNKKYVIDILLFFFVATFSFLINQYYGYLGIVPLDDFLNFNSGYRILKGDIPFKDYYSITGPFLSIIQSYYFKLFGLSWFSFVLNASILNTILSLSIFLLLKKLNISNFLNLSICICIAILSYPNNGVPGVDHHAWIICVIGYLVFYTGLLKKNIFLLSITPLLFLISFFTKQVPSIYFLIITLLIYIYYCIHIKKLLAIKYLSVSSFLYLFLIFLLFNYHDLNFNFFLEQYFLISFDLGNSRFISSNLDSVLENISNIQFLVLLSIPFLINLLNNFQSEDNEKNFIVYYNSICIFSLIFISILYELHTNNQAMTFMILPLIVFFLYKVQEKINETKLLKFFYFLMITYCFYRIIQNELIYVFLFLSFAIFLAFYRPNKKAIKYNCQYLLIIYLLLTTLYYFQSSINPRKYKDINTYDKGEIFSGGQIHNIFNKVQWITSSQKFKKDEINKIKVNLDYLKKLDENFIFVTDYQIFNPILDLKDYSPVKYWYTGNSYPSKDSKFRKNFEKFFYKKILENNVGYLIIDDEISLFKENINDYENLYKCLLKLQNNEVKNLIIYKINKLCLQKVLSIH